MIESGVSQIAPLPVDHQTDDLRGWLERTAIAHDLTWLLANGEDGAIWGVIEGGLLVISSEAFKQNQLRLRWAALAQARLFGARGEALLWPGPGGWQARYRDDTAGTEVSYIDERQLLWGTWSADPTRTVAPFTLLVEGRQGIQHAPPVADGLADGQRARLRVRHYLAESAITGVVQVVDSRLVAVEPHGGRR
jgi:CRISPR-associated protein (TIGR03984 family)